MIDVEKVRKVLDSYHEGEIWCSSGNDGTIVLSELINVPCWLSEEERAAAKVEIERRLTEGMSAGGKYPTFRWESGIDDDSTD